MNRILAGLCALVLLSGGAAAYADEPLNPKDALAPIFRENPKLADPQADLLRSRNEGIAHYEGGLTLDRAIASFQAAYDIGHQPADAFNMALVYMKQNKTAEARGWAEKSLEGNPDFAAGQYLLGLIDKLDGHPDAALAHWKKANALNPTDPALHYQLAMLASTAGDEHGFLQELLRALELDPEHKSSLYQMYRYYQTAGNKEMAGATMKRFIAAKSTEKFSRKDRLFDDSSFTLPLRDDPLHAAAGSPVLNAAISVNVTRTELGCKLTRLARITVMAPPAHEDLLGVCADGTLLRVAGGNTETLGSLDAPAEDVQVAWLDAKGPRIITAGPTGVRMSTPLGQAPLSFELIDDKPAHRLVLADFEHDGSLDILTDASTTPLARVGGKYLRPAAVAPSPALGETFQGHDLQVADLRRRGMADLISADGSDVQVILAGAAGYREGPRFPFSGAVAQLGLADLDNQGRLDLVAATGDGLAIVWGAAAMTGAPPADAVTKLDAAAARFAIADLSNDGRRDIVTIDQAGQAAVFVNTGPRRFERRPLGAAPAPATDPVVFDQTRDGLLDVAYVDTTGALVVLRNTTTGAGGSIDVLLAGRRSPPTGQLTQVELRKGALYAYAQSDGGLVHLGLGTQGYAEIVRLEWPNGFVENKIKVDAATETYAYLESERIAGSCPTIFVRTPDGFRYVTDAMITTAIGILEQRDEYFEFGNEEHVVIPPGLLTELDGHLDFRITEELRETTYIDHAALLAVDHPAGAQVGSVDRLAPPSPETAPFYVARRLVPAAHANYEGQDITELLAKHDGRYADTVRRTRSPGFAESSEIDLTLGDDVDPAKVDAVYATGWFQAFDSTAVIGTFKGGTPDFQFPELQEKVDGKWQSAGFIGIPAGQNRTAVLNLAHPLRSRELRLLSNFSTYWDEIAFSVDGEAPAKITDLPLQDASLRFHGFSKPVSRDPEVFDYDNVEYGMLWSPMPGRFTDYGPILPLLAKQDGSYAVMGGGDEIALSFQAPVAPPPPGYERSYVLVLDGHVKDADRYTARSENVEPMPTLSMTEYPPKPGAPAAPENPISVALRNRPGLDYTLTSASAGQEQPHE